MNHAHADDDSCAPLPVVVVFDGKQTQLGAAIEYDAALTLWATVSEDPANWQEMAAYWPRYRCPGTPEFLDGLPFQQCDRSDALEAIQGHDDWLVIDLSQKRLLAGAALQRLGRDATLAVGADEQGKRGCPLPFHLPPWWELFEAASADLLPAARENEIQIPKTNRPFLFGAPMIEDLATRILKVAAEGRLPEMLGAGGADEDAEETFIDRETANALHQLTVEVHRDWLMTPRADLGGRYPRQLLHGAHDWSGSIIQGQRMRFEYGAEMIAAPDDAIGYDDAPMGREEMIIYFDLCREVIQAGWNWVVQERAMGTLGAESEFADQQSRLVNFLADVRDTWLSSPFEGGSPASFIIECSRRRVPRGSQVPIRGMDQCESEQHMPDCDCPICDMLASGMFGVGFTWLDGHHLKLDEEFAFSTHEFIEDWQRQQDDFRAMDERFARERAEREARIAAGERTEDVYASAWSGPMTAAALPGDPDGYLKLAFRLAEILSDLERCDAPQELITRLNESYRDYRECDEAQRPSAKEFLQGNLNDVADQFPPLTLKVADFLSLLDERERGSLCTGEADFEDDFPF